MHTPGPWTIGEDEGTSMAHEILGKRGQCVGWTASNEPYEEGNARLIAAAPEMLATLQAILPPDGQSTGEWWGLSEEEQRERIRALLARIEGR